MPTTTIYDTSSTTGTIYERGDPTAYPRPLAVMWAGLRLTLGFMLLWAFFDKLLGLGYSTRPEASWLNGGSPTQGFLDRASGPAAGFFQAISGHAAVDALFMAGLLLIGAALVLGIGLRVAGVSGALLFLLMWAASMPGRNNPLVDQHVVYAIILLGMMRAPAGQTLGLGNWWAQQPLVRRFPLLK